VEGEGGAPAVGGGVPAAAAGQEGVAVDLGAGAQVGGVGLGEREVEQGEVLGLLLGRALAEVGGLDVAVGDAFDSRYLSAERRSSP
jgi:hypothetical protein